jgi:hypothetical protein
MTKEASELVAWRMRRQHGGGNEGVAHQAAGESGWTYNACGGELGAVKLKLIWIDGGLMREVEDRID